MYASLVRMQCMLVFSQRFPLGLGMPSALSVLVMSRALLPFWANWKMRLTTPSAGGSGSSFGRLLVSSSRAGIGTALEPVARTRFCVAK